MTAQTQMQPQHASQNRAKTNMSPHGCIKPKQVPASTRNKLTTTPLWQVPNEAAPAPKKPTVFFPSQLPTRKNSVFRTRNDNKMLTEAKRLTGTSSQRQLITRPDQLMRDIKAATTAVAQNMNEY